jgi:fumarate reductase flavoprotein subunit
MADEEGKVGIGRRDFLKGSLAVGAAAAIGGLVSYPSSASASTTTSWDTPPDAVPDSAITSTITADIVVVGSGVAGLNAARAASEAGASVIVIEKATTYQYRSGQYGTIGSTIAKNLGNNIDKTACVNGVMKEMGYRANEIGWKYWAEHSGEDFDWLMELAPDAVVIKQTDKTYDDSKITLVPLHFPEPKAFDPADEYSPAYPTVLAFLPDQGAMLKLVYQKCLALGATFKFSTWARQLIRPNNTGRVEGVLCQDAAGTAAGTYTKVLATKAVILCTGDFAGDKDMLGTLCPWATNFSNFFPNTDAAGTTTNTGDGQKMGVWIGAKMEDGPLAPMVHTLGSCLGTDAFLQINAEGFRFCNEDVAGQQLSNQLYRQKGNYSWQIFDNRYPSQVGLMGSYHGSVNYVVSEAKYPDLTNNGTIGRGAYTTRKRVEATSGIVIKKTIKDLVAGLGMDATARANAIASINRYNELCAAGVDEDFGKVSKRMFSVSKPPFYATKLTAGAMLVCMGGLTVEPETCNVLDSSYDTIPGLYAAGNAMGERFVVDYPVVAAGASHGTALVFGRLAAQSAVATA